MYLAPVLRGQAVSLRVEILREFFFGLQSILKSLNHNYIKNKNRDGILSKKDPSLNGRQSVQHNLRFRASPLPVYHPPRGCVTWSPSYWDLQRLGPSST